MEGKKEERRKGRNKEKHKIVNK